MVRRFSPAEVGGISLYGQFLEPEQTQEDITTICSTIAPQQSRSTSHGEPVRLGRKVWLYSSALAISAVPRSARTASCGKRVWVRVIQARETRILYLPSSLDLASRSPARTHSCVRVLLNSAMASTTWNIRWRVC
jgi:hypothetical protein